MNIRSVVIT